MLNYSMTFFLIALVAAGCGLWGASGWTSGIAAIFCALFVALSLITLAIERRGPLS